MNPIQSLRNAFLAGLFLFVIAGCASRTNPDVGEFRGFWSEQPARNWENALLTGNGTQGVLVMGVPLSDTLILSHARLYMPLHEPLPPVNSGVRLDTVRQMMFDGKFGEASQYVVDLSKREGWDGKRWTDPFVPAFDLRIQMIGDSLVSGYKRSVNFRSGEASVSWKGALGAYRRDVFASRADTIVVVRIRGEANAPVSCRISLADRPKDNSWWQGLYNSTIRSTKVSAEKDWLFYQGSFDQEWPGSLKGLAGAVRVISKGGSCRPDGTDMIVDGAREVILLVKVEPAFDRPGLDSGNFLEAVKDRMPAGNASYDRLLKEHTSIHEPLFRRMELDLGGGADRQLPTEELLIRSVKIPVPALIEKQFDAARYNILCATGIMPPNLQGIWAGTTAPPWSGDFTQNGNLQVAIASLLPGNLPELMEGFFSYQETMLPHYRQNARLLYNCRGIHVASRTSSHGLNNHFDRTWPMTFWTAGAAWMAEFFYDYYRFTGDVGFLRQRAFPFMREAALFYEDFLIPGPDNKWVFVPSYSPENNPGNSPDQACINATMDIMAARQLFRNLIDAGKRLGMNADSLAKWTDFLSKMPDYQINADGALREYCWDSLSDNYAHRHASHLYGLWNERDPDIMGDPRLVEACRRAVDERMKVRRQEDGGVMAFGMVQLALAAASVGDAVAVQDMINWLGSVYWNPNLVTLHNPHELFNLDLSGGFPAVIMQALILSEPGTIELRPACPPEWKSGEIKGMRLRGQILVKSMKWDEKEIELRLVSEIDQVVKIRVGYGGSEQAVELFKGRERIFHSCGVETNLPPTP